MSVALLSKNVEPEISTPKSANLPRRLRFTQADDSLEQEAERAADDVVNGLPVRWSLSQVNMSNGLPRSCDCGGTSNYYKTGRPFQRTAANETTAASASPEIYDALHSSTERLSQNTRKFLEPHFGLDLGEVRIHTGTPAELSARAISAKAYTVGKDIVFGNAQYRPESTEGKKLLAHEVAHVVQQQRFGAGLVQRMPSDDPKPASITISNIGDLSSADALKILHDERHSIITDAKGVSLKTNTSITPQGTLAVARVGGRNVVTVNTDKLTAETGAKKGQVPSAWKQREASTGVHVLTDAQREAAAAQVELTTTEMRATSKEMAEAVDSRWDRIVNLHPGKGAAALTQPKGSKAASLGDWLITLRHAEGALLVKAVKEAEARGLKLEELELFVDRGTCSYACRPALGILARAMGIKRLVIHQVNLRSSTISTFEQGIPHKPEDFLFKDPVSSISGTPSSLGVKAATTSSRPTSQEQLVRSRPLGSAKSRGSASVAAVGAVSSIAAAILSDVLFSKIESRLQKMIMEQEEKNLQREIARKLQDKKEEIARLQLDNPDSQVYVRFSIVSLLTQHTRPSMYGEPEQSFRSPAPAITLEGFSLSLADTPADDHEFRTGDLDNFIELRRFTRSVPISADPDEVKKLMNYKERQELLEHMRQLGRQGNEVGRMSIRQPRNPFPRPAPSLRFGELSIDPELVPTLGGPGVSPEQEAATEVQSYKEQCAQLIDQGERLSASSQTHESDISAFKLDVDRWFTAAKIKLSESVSGVGREGMDELLNGDNFGRRLLSISERFGD